FTDPGEYLRSVSRVVGSRSGPPLDIEARALKALAEEFRADEPDMQHAIITQSPFVDAMNYVQLGFPERVILRPAGWAARPGAPSRSSRRSADP
ncbi:MAG TPA: hypothetical protein VF470_08005, partial [Sphingomicrobium sp.]